MFVLINLITIGHQLFCHFPKSIYSVQLLLGDPNPDDFINEVAAKLYKKDRIIYNETFENYTSLFANYLKFQEDLTKLNIIHDILEKEERSGCFKKIPFIYNYIIRSY